MGRSAVVFGATGLIGGHLLQYLLKDPGYRRVTAVVRRPTGIQDSNFQEVISDFYTIRAVGDKLHGDVYFCCLGSTRKKTPRLGAYYRIDHDYPVAAAEIAKANAVQTFVLVSAIGANPNSRNFYMKTKGETERDVIKAGIPQTLIFRPSLLTGRRTENRMLERLASGVMALANPLLVGKMSRYRSVQARSVAGAMKKLSEQTFSGTATFYWRDIKTWQ